MIYRCINPACARPMPRPVKFCPWCGTAQGAAASAPGAEQPAPRETAAATPASPQPATAATAASAEAAPAPARPQPEPPPARSSTGAPPPSATDFGRTGAKQAGTVPARGFQSATPPPRQEVPRPPIPARPGEARPKQRQPVRLRWWILALAVLWGVWLLAKPGGRKFEQRIDHAIALAKECKGSEAQAELIALRSSRASSSQLERLQDALNEESAICTKRRQRNKAWLEASSAAETALAAGGVDKARTRLQAFIRRWGEDDKTRALKARIDAAAEREHPLAVPRDQAAARAPSDLF
jgi:hypothetical protein